VARHARAGRSGIILACTLTVCGLSAMGTLAATSTGAFIAFGGGAEPPGLARDFAGLTREQDTRVLVIPAASDTPEESLARYTRMFSDEGVRDVAQLTVTDRESADENGPTREIALADLMFFTGGDQRRLVDLLSNTALHGAIQTSWLRRAVLAGTSAGAMVWGQEYIAAGTSQGAITLGYGKDVQGLPGLEMRPGLGLLEGVLVDTHFREQVRLGRLSMAIASSPGTVGVGVDEGTAAVIMPESIQATGSGCVTLLDVDDARFNNASQVVPGNPLAIGKATMHRLLPGATYIRKWKNIAGDQVPEPVPQPAPRTAYAVAVGSDVPRANLAPITEFVKIAGGNQARILMLAGERTVQGMALWRTALLKRGALSVVTETNLTLSERVLTLALQQARGVMFLEDDRASLLRALDASGGNLGRILVEHLERNNLPVLAAGNAVRLLGERAHFGSPGDPQEFDLPGLGCLPRVVLDKRVWSPDGPEVLLREALPVPGCVAFGLSSDTALVVSGPQASVAGTGTVVVLDLQRATGLNPAPSGTSRPSGAHGIGFSLLPPQSSYDLVSREPRS